MDMLRVRTVWTGVAGTPYYTNLFFGTASGTAAATHNDVVGFISGLQSYFGTGLTATIEGEMAVIASETGQQVGTATVPAVQLVGQATGELLPRATQGLIKWNTGIYQNGRRVIGRTFVPCPTESQSSNGEPAGSYVNGLTVAANTLATETTSDLLVFSKTGLAAWGVVSGAGWTQWAVLRSRRD